MFASQKDSGNFRKIKTEVEGRLPIRRPSVIEQGSTKTKLSPFNKPSNSFALLGKPKEELMNNDQKDEKNDLDYIAHNENEDREDLNSFLSRSLFTNKFQLVWALVLFLAHTYHVLALFYYLGIPDFPSGGILALQIFMEAVLIIDLTLRLTLRHLSEDVWESMWLLHDYFGLNSKVGLTITIIGTLPIMFIIT